MQRLMLVPATSASAFGPVPAPARRLPRLLEMLPAVRPLSTRLPALPAGKLPAMLLVLMLCLPMVIAAPSADARECAIDEQALVPVELSGVGISPVNGVPLVLLRHLASGDVVPIVVGIEQARAILLAMHGVEVPRPMTHDLVVDVLGTLGVTLERVLVDDLVNSTYLGMLELRLPDSGELIRIDSRPSDALALAVRTGASILVAHSVLIASADLGYEALPGDQQVLTALGITVIEAGTDAREALDLPDGAGVLVHRLVGAAARTALRPGAFIRSVNGTEVATPMQFLEAVRTAPDDALVHIRFWQDGSEAELELDRSAGSFEPRGPVTSA